MGLVNLVEKVCRGLCRGPPCLFDQGQLSQPERQAVYALMIGPLKILVKLNVFDICRVFLYLHCTI